MKNKKPKFAFISLTSDDGCMFSVLERGEQIFEFFQVVDMRENRLIEERSSMNNKDEEYDITLVEGSVVTKEDLEKLKLYREKSKILIAVGACAVTGGIPKIKNYIDKDKALKKVYPEAKEGEVDNMDLKPLHEYVKIDMKIPGCAPNPDEIMRVLYEVKEGILPSITNRPVCYECQANEYECLLQKGKPCIGPLITGGCGAVCPKNGYPCDGCRGPLAEPKVGNLEKKLKEIVSEEELQNIYERFGNKDLLAQKTKDKRQNK